MVSDKNSFSHFPYIGHCRTCDPWGRAIFAPCKGYNLNKLGRGPLGDASYQISIDFSRFLYINLCKAIDPQGGTIFGRRDIILINMWCYIPTIKALGLVVSDKTIFHIFYIYAYVKRDPWDGDIFGPRAIIWANLAGGPLGDAKYQSSIV